MPTEVPMDNGMAEGVAEYQEESVEFSPDGASQPVENGDHNNPEQAGDLDVKLVLSEEDKSEIVKYLENNLVNMRMSDDEENRIKNYLSMYDMATRRRDFPYEDAPSIPSSDAYDKLNEWLDKAEVAFLITNGTFAIDREESNLDEETIRRMEKTWHKKYFWGSGFAEELRLILFEAGYLGGSILSVRESFDVEPQREKIIIKTVKDLTQYQMDLSKGDYKKAQKAVAENQIFMGERDVLKVKNAGAKIGRVKQTNFLFPQNETNFKKWQIVSEMEYYTRSDMLAMAEMGELDVTEVNKAISKIREQSEMDEEDKQSEKLPEGVRPSSLDMSYKTNSEGIKQHGEAYEEEFCVYRTTLKYKVPTKEDPSGALRSWIEVIYCPAGKNILSSTFCKHGFPYHLVQYRPVPHRAIGLGIAHARYPFNVFDSDMKSLFMASLEQEIGAPTLINKNSDLWASGFRTYPGSVAYTGNPEKDVVAFRMPEKSRLAVEGMKIVLGSSPGANKGAGYASGKREEILQGQRDTSLQSRMHAIAVGLDAPINMAWRIQCQIAKLNTRDTKWIDWVYDLAPSNTKLYMLSSEMDKDIVWTSTLSAISMSPDALFAQAMQLYQIFHQNVPVSVNSPRLSVNWLQFLAGFVSQMDDKHRTELLPNDQDYQVYQQSLGQMGGEREVTAATAQSPATPFHRPPNQGAQQSGQSNPPRRPPTAG